MGAVAKKGAVGHHTIHSRLCYSAIYPRSSHHEYCVLVQALHERDGSAKVLKGKTRAQVRYGSKQGCVRNTCERMQLKSWSPGSYYQMATHICWYWNWAHSSFISMQNVAKTPHPLFSQYIHLTELHRLASKRIWRMLYWSKGPYESDQAASISLRQDQESTRGALGPRPFSFPGVPVTSSATYSERGLPAPLEEPASESGMWAGMSFVRILDQEHLCIHILGYVLTAWACVKGLLCSQGPNAKPWFEMLVRWHCTLEATCCSVSEWVNVKLVAFQCKKKARKDTLVIGEPAFWCEREKTGAGFLSGQYGILSSFTIHACVDFLSFVCGIVWI